MKKRNKALFLIILIVIICAVIAALLLKNRSSERTLTDRLRTSMDTAVLDHCRTEETEKHFAAADYDVLKISGSKDRTTVYARVLYEEFEFDGTDAWPVSGSHIPTAVTFDTSGSEDGAAPYKVAEYWEPRDGSYYSDDIKDKFPKSIRKEASDLSGYEKLHENCLNKAREYYKKYGLISDTETDMEVLREGYPQYFGLSAFKGLEVYVWQTAKDSYSFGVMEGTNISKTTEQLLDLKGVSLDTMKTILSTYDIPEEYISVIPFNHPLSSYYYEITDEYTSKVRAMLFADEPYETKTAYVNWTEDAGIYTGSLNTDKMAVSSVRHLPVYKLDTLEDLDRFGETFKDVLTLDHGYNEVPSYADVTSVYDETFFSENSVIMAYIPASSGTFRYKIFDTAADGTSFCLNVVQTNDPEAYTADMAGWLVMAEVPDRDLKGITEYDAKMVSYEEAIGGLFDEIMSSPSTSSNSRDYLMAHEGEHLKLLENREAVLKYIFGKFLEGRQGEPESGLKGELMMTILNELAPESETGDLYASAQERFNALADRAQQQRDEYGDEWMESNQPEMYMLLKMAER